MNAKKLLPIISIILVLGTFPALFACNGESERYEKIDKLRAFGVATNPVVAEPSTTSSTKQVTLTFYAAVPLDAKVSAAPFVDDEAKYSVPIDLSIVSESYQAYAKFQVYAVQATADIPKDDELVIPANPGYARLRYAMKLTAGDEEEKIVGNFLVYPSGAAELNWQAPQVDIAAPIADSTVSGDSDLQAVLNGSIDESLRVGWFVSGGKVKNRNAANTTWQSSDSGAQTVILTACGHKSGAFAYKVVDVTVQ